MRDDDDIDDDVGISDGNYTVEGGIDSPLQAITVLRVAWRRWWRYIVPLLHIAVAVANVIFVVIVVGVVVVVGDCAAWWRCLL